MCAKKANQFGKLKPMYRFILNPYTETRFTRCPNCERKNRTKKLPLLIFVEPTNFMVLNYTCRYCPSCDLLVAHQDQIEDLLAATFVEVDPAVIGNDYLVLGTVDRAVWRAGMKDPGYQVDVEKDLHDFKEVLEVEYKPAGWYPPDELRVGKKGAV